MSEPFPPLPVTALKRRSTRVLHSVPVIITAKDTDGKSVREETTTLSINCHGCRYFSQNHLRKNAKVSVRLGGAAATPGATKQSVAGRIAWIQKSRRLTGLYQVGVEFDAPQNIWQIEDAPDDWIRFAPPPIENTASFLVEVEQLLQLAHAGTYYQILAVKFETPRLEVKHQFYQLARRFHPDHHMTHPEWTPRLLVLMDALTIAYKTLSDDGAKKEYDEHLLKAGSFQLGQQKSQAQVLAHECLEKARECLAAKNYVGSILWLRRAIEAEPHSSKYRTMLARSLSAVPEYRHEAIEQFEKALELDPFNITAHLQFGQMLENIKLPWRARPHYVRILELDTQHVEARERLRQMDATEPRPSSRPSLLNRLTGRN